MKAPRSLGGTGGFMFGVLNFPMSLFDREIQFL